MLSRPHPRAEHLVELLVVETELHVRLARDLKSAFRNLQGWIDVHDREVAAA
ncbi:hypothetical protein JYT28_00245 [Desulfobulbus sp. AH-315-M07]|nr:hypothetical protein [Desulfobulbus sp. AH-315-M07]